MNINILYNILRMSQKAEFKITYDGEALQNHTMDVKDLAPALLSLGQLFDESNRVLNDDTVKVNLKVKAVGEGSFETILDFHQEIKGIVDIFGKDDFVNSKMMVDCIFGVVGGGWGLWKFISWIRNRKVAKIEKIDDELLKIEVDGETHIIHKNVLPLYKDIAVRKASEDILKPLEKEGIDLFLVKEDNQEIQRVGKEEIGNFEFVDGEEEVIILQTELETVYSIKTLSFKEGNKWRLFDGNTTLWVDILDKEFLEKVDSNVESFSKGDFLICEVRITQYTINHEMKTRHEIIKVKEHKKASQQISLFNNNKNEKT